LQPWVKAGLVVETDPTAEEGIIFQLEWGSKQFHAFLRRLFPKLFDHLDSVSPGVNALPDEPDSVGTRKIDYTLPYVLLQKDRKKYHLVDVAHPTALKYREYTSNEGGSSGFRSKGIFLGTYLCFTASQRYQLTLPPSHKGAYSTRDTEFVVLPFCCSHRPCPFSTNCYGGQAEEDW
jgi:hypothetical protein